MNSRLNTAFFKLLRLALRDDTSEELQAVDFPKLSDGEWERLYNEVDRQTLLGVAFNGVKKLPPEFRPPFDIMFQWSSEAETVNGLNGLMNGECKRLTEFFQAEGLSTAILKGQANARLYPDAKSRQPGDIDIWVSGGKNFLVKLLKKKDLLEDKCFRSAHHVHMRKGDNGVDVEIHFRPSSGNLNPFSNSRLLRYLNREIHRTQLVPEGFNVPNMRFALVMQLAHIQRHFFGGGVGMRQLMDYFVLLKSSSCEDHKAVSKHLKSFGLYHIAGAAMWLLQEVFGLDADLMLCRPDKFRGRWLLRDVMHGGNFGKHVANGPRLKWLYWWLNRRRSSLSHWCFDVPETLGAELEYWMNFMRNVSLRIRLGKISLRDARF